jgi:membrane-bound lytic murein transglycosylase D
MDRDFKGDFDSAKGCAVIPKTLIRGKSLMIYRYGCFLLGALALLSACSFSAPNRPSPVTATPAPSEQAEAALPSPVAPPASAGGGDPQNSSAAQITRPPVIPQGKAPAGELLENGEECIVEDEDDEILTQPAKGKEPSLNRALVLCRVAQNHWKRGDIDAAIDTLDQAYALVLRVVPGNDPNLLQEMEDLRITISRRILEVYSSRHVVVNGRRNEIPVTLNRHVQDEIDAFTVGRERDFFLEAYRRSGKYRIQIEAALKEASLPPELSWLPLIESGFKVTAFSPARALGLWQFIPSTGYRYGLNRDTYIDERLDPEKATRGAIEYLKELHGMFGDWTTVLAAYNCGEHRVLRTIQSQNINYLDNFWDLYERLPRETARYVPRFLATLHIVNSLQEYGLNDVVVDPPLESEIVTIPRQASLAAIARSTGIDDDLLRMLNAELRQGVLPEDGYDLRVPSAEKSQVLAKLDDIPAYQAYPARKPQGTAVARHKVRKGETLQTISQKYGTDAKSILLANNMRRPAPLAAGTILRVPIACPPERSPTLPEPKAATAKRETIEHVVRQGDSLYNLAKRYGTTTEGIQRQNRVTASSLAIGQVLKITPAAAPAKSEAPRAKPAVYAVRNGDTVHSIAKRHNMAVDRLLALNQLNAKSKLQPGQKVIVEN